MPEYFLKNVMNTGLVLLRRTGYGGEDDTAMWTTRRVRKSGKCPVSFQKINAGDDAFGPVGNQQYRAERISRYGMEMLRTRAIRDSDRSGTTEGSGSPTKEGTDSHAERGPQASPKPSKG